MLDNKELLLSALLLLVLPATAQENDSVKSSDIQVSAAIEFNHGSRLQNGETTRLLDIPHVTAGVDINLHKGWTFAAEVEYEQFLEDGEWQGDFKDNFAVNKFYVNKRWMESFNVKAGIIDIPVGLTNAGGPALTIYDPLSEASILPMTWHSFGAAVWGNVDKWRYEIGVYGRMDGAIKESSFSGVAARLDYRPIENLNLGISSYYGKDVNCGKNDALYATFDFAYDANGWLIDGLYVHSNVDRLHSFGTEVGYNLLNLSHSNQTGDNDLCLMPYARIDHVYQSGSALTSEYTCGVHLSPVSGLILKVGYGIHHEPGASNGQMLDFSLGYGF